MLYTWNIDDVFVVYLFNKNTSFIRRECDFCALFFNLSMSLHLHNEQSVLVLTIFKQVLR